jgi:8-amino-7-oxononanoate synthase
MREFPSLLNSRFERQRDLGLERKVSLGRGVDFCSNDYLGFATDAELHRRIHAATRDLPIGSAGSRLLRGHLEIHESAERTLAEFCGEEAALLYPSGYQANVGLLSALLTSADRVYSDESNHASIIDGIRLSGSTKRIYRHADMSHLEVLLREDAGCTGLKLIVTESLFSMEGDFAPLREISALARRYGAELVVDEAHATGIFGSGLVSTLAMREHVLATVHTGGKALGISGAWIAGSKQLKDYLFNFSRSQIFSTSVSPWLAAGLATSVDYYHELGLSRALNVQEKIRRLRTRSLGETASGDRLSPVFYWTTGTPQSALEAAASLQSQGFDVRAIRPPTVPENRCGLRVTVKWTNTESEIDALALALSKWSVA